MLSVKGILSVNITQKISYLWLISDEHRPSKALANINAQHMPAADLVYVITRKLRS
jgi:hypothetical protein